MRGTRTAREPGAEEARAIVERRIREQERGGLQ
jgi:hypothetical protein